MKSIVLSLIILFSTSLAVLAQAKQNISEEEKYINVIKQRANKIVSTLSIADSSKALKVSKMIADQYFNLKEIHDERDKMIELAKKKSGENKITEDELKKIDDKIDPKLNKLHTKYLTKLGKELSPDQIDKVKDGMTYSVLPITFKGYLSMIPTLTEEQKDQILIYLKEGREHAMNAGSSEEKHKWFGKYKGKINNYLSSQGYDLKKEQEEWAKRLKEESTSKSE